MTKKQKKEQQQQQWGFTVNGSIPMVLIEADIDVHIQNILREIVDGIATIGIQLVVLEPQDEHFRAVWKTFTEKYPKSVRMVPSREADLDAFDMTVLDELTPSRVQELKEHQLVPVAEKGVMPFDPIAEKGNGFVFQENPWSLFAALVRAAETYRFPYDWQNIVKAMGKER